MAKYYDFHYSSEDDMDGVDEMFEFDDNAPECYVQEAFDEWCKEKQREEGDFE